VQYKQLGDRGPIVSTIGFGAWAIGGVHWGKTDDEVSLRAIHEAIDQGVTLIDTADVYGFGHSEELISRVIRERGKQNLVLATKAGSDFYNPDPSDDDGYGAITPNYSKEYLMWAAEQSLKRLKVDALDILQLHSPALSLLERDEPWLALEALKRDGKILHAGLSIKSFEETKQAPLMELHHDILDCIQVRYNLLEREAEDLLFPKALEHGIGVIVRIPLLFGLLSGKFDRNSKFGKDDHRRMNLSAEKLNTYLEDLEGHQDLFDRYKEQTKTQVSLRFAISHPACQTAIPGAKTSEQVRENCSSSDLGPIQ
jgi:aryl-alcohol dehydrogenase-like predicted oxidoreductase